MQQATSNDRSPSILPGMEGFKLLQNISGWGNTTTIIMHGGCVFEFKGDFPKGELSEGFYNLKGQTGFEGHLNLNKIAYIALQSKNHRGRESHAFVFMDESDEVIFKIFLGRDEHGNLLSSQLEKFQYIQSTLRL